MGETFWTYTIWYVALAVASVAVLIITLLNTRERLKTLAFWLGILGFAYCIEITLLLVTHAYTYYPMLIDDPFFDAVLGNMFSQVSVSTSAVLLCTLGLSNWWLGGFSVVYYLIDILYVHLGVYEHFWYRSVYTLAGFIVFGFIVRFWRRRVFCTSPRLIVSTLVLGAWALASNLLGTGLRLTGLRTLQSGIYTDPSRDQTATGIIYFVLLIGIMVILVRWQKPLRLKLWLLATLPFLQLGLILTGVMQLKSGWTLFVPLADLAVCFGIVRLLNTALQTGSRPALSAKKPDSYQSGHSGAH